MPYSLLINPRFLEFARLHIFALPFLSEINLQKKSGSHLKYIFTGVFWFRRLLRVQLKDLLGRYQKCEKDIWVSCSISIRQIFSYHLTLSFQWAMEATYFVERILTFCGKGVAVLSQTRFAVFRRFCSISCIKSVQCGDSSRYEINSRVPTCLFRRSMLWLYDFILFVDIKLLKLLFVVKKAQSISYKKDG